MTINNPEPNQDEPILLELIWSYWHEEAMLVQALGDQYESYRAKTWRLIPLVY